MKREDFREITEKHIESCKEIIKCNGVCANVNCNECPFDGLNEIEYNTCGDKGYSTSGVNNTEEDKKLLQSAKEFLELFESDFKRTVDFVEIDDITKESIKIELEGIRNELDRLFSHNRNLSLVITKIDEAIMWLEKDISEENKK